MAGRPFGVWAYGYGPYSRWHGVVIGLSLIGRGAISRPRLMLPALHLVGVGMTGRSNVAARLNNQAVLHLSGAMGARGGLDAPLRFYWEHEPPSKCGNDWVVQPKPPYDCPCLEVTHG